MADIWFTVPDSPDETELRDLRRWLADSPELRGVRITERHTPVPAETMPGAGIVDALLATVTDKATAAAVITGAAGWVTARLSMRRTRLRIRQGDKEIEVDTAAIRDIDDLAAWMRQQLDDHPTDP
ncbi:effector-associated constant component EACC1 [Actinoplanes sp. RD1]|uniref:effector-associated constant component EACC1 n=1 Tax=Actinoplanes sp. RD1 TaxID=3064538 RepID=UPI002740C701|nr:hypothetical protein [Actinoplanes sp. RD1]